MKGLFIPTSYKLFISLGKTFGAYSFECCGGTIGEYFSIFLDVRGFLKAAKHYV